MSKDTPGRASEKLAIEWITQTYENATTTARPLCLVPLFHLQRLIWDHQGEAFDVLSRTMPQKYPRLMNALVTFVFSASRVARSIDALLDKLAICSCDRSIPMIDKMHTTHISDRPGESCWAPGPGMTEMHMLRTRFADWILGVLCLNVEEAVQGKIATKMRSPGTLKPKDQGYREMGRLCMDEPAMVIEPLVAWYRTFEWVWALRIIITFKHISRLKGAPLNTLSCYPLSLFHLIDAVLGRIHFSMSFFTGQKPVPHLVEPWRKNAGNPGDRGSPAPDNAKYAGLCAEFVNVALCNACHTGRTDAISLEDLATSYKRLKAVLDPLMTHLSPEKKPGTNAEAQARRWQTRIALSMTVATMHRMLTQADVAMVEVLKGYEPSEAMMRDVHESLSKGGDDPMTLIAKQESYAVTYVALRHLRDEKRCMYFLCKRSPEPGEKPFSLCTGCRVFSYCSRECQKIGWAKDHRRLCPDVAKLSTVWGGGTLHGAKELAEKNPELSGLQVAPTIIARRGVTPAMDSALAELVKGTGLTRQRIEQLKELLNRYHHGMMAGKTMEG